MREVLQLTSLDASPTDRPPFLRKVRKDRSMNCTDRQTWEQVRARGRLQFILSGILQRGIRFAAPFTIAFFVIDWWVLGIINPWSEAKRIVIIYVLLTVAVGWGEGEVVWAKQERDYRRGTSN